MKCEWCDANEATAISCTVYWELPDGSRAIEITETPGFYCNSCGMEYQSEKIIIQLEDQLMIIDTKKLEKTTTYEQLMAQPKLLKQNYFRFN
ncbi:YokU family protein [Halalkalibacter alkalisediminis]|uniref:YokU family protein n=1 Tax=Halalkalibacter alkalisediminis TaxID=935616 RepID=A0ABV6NG66_9BACI|nr:YokU family protein [Halalkalibacter alkalisediminis]